MIKLFYFSHVYCSLINKQFEIPFLINNVIQSFFLFSTIKHTDQLHLLLVCAYMCMHVHIYTRTGYWKVLNPARRPFTTPKI